MGALDRKRLDGLLDEFARVRLLVVGDLVLDEYVWGDVDRVSPEAPVPVVRVLDETLVLGGAANVARNLVALGGQAALVSTVGDDDAGARVRALVEELGVDPAGLVRVGGRPTTRKTRVIARTQQVVRFDRERVDPLSPDVGARVVDAVERELAGVSGAVIEDYGKGALGGDVAAALMQRLQAAGLPAVVDPKASLQPYRGAALVKPNLREAEALAGHAISSDADLMRAAEQIREQIGGGAVAITRGSEGMALFDGSGPLVAVPTVAREVFDVQGAGDTAIAALALALRAGGSLLESAVIANAAAGVVVAKVGTATADIEETREWLGDAIDAAERARA
jgi:D-beta-D-heptose 7-phosphate kinase/D-beta-D-heptose 1-phosphate adenosyltransferase